MVYANERNESCFQIAQMQVYQVAKVGNIGGIDLRDPYFRSGQKRIEFCEHRSGTGADIERIFVLDLPYLVGRDGHARSDGRGIGIAALVNDIHGRRKIALIIAESGRVNRECDLGTVQGQRQSDALCARGRDGVHLGNELLAADRAGQRITVGRDVRKFDGSDIGCRFDSARTVKSARYIVTVSQGHPALVGLSPEKRRLTGHLFFLGYRNRCALRVTSDNGRSRRSGSGADIGRSIRDDPFLAVGQGQRSEIDLIFAEIVKIDISLRRVAVVEIQCGLIQMFKGYIPVTSREFCRSVDPVVPDGFAPVEQIADKDDRIRIGHSLLIAVLNVGVNGVLGVIVLSLSSDRR